MKRKFTCQASSALRSPPAPGAPNGGPPPKPPGGPPCAKSPPPEFVLHAMLIRQQQSRLTHRRSAHHRSAGSACNVHVIISQRMHFLCKRLIHRWLLPRNSNFPTRSPGRISLSHGCKWQRDTLRAYRRHQSSIGRRRVPGPLLHTTISLGSS